MLAPKGYNEDIYVGATRQKHIISYYCAIYDPLLESRFTGNSSCGETNVYRLDTWSQSCDSITTIINLRTYIFPPERTI
jgi:hypothetical protein